MASNDKRTRTLTKALVPSDANKIVFYNPTTGRNEHASIGANLTLSGNTLQASGSVGSDPPDGDKGDIVVSSSGTVWTVDTNAVDFNQIQQTAAYTLVGNPTSKTGDLQAINSSAFFTSLVSTATAEDFRNNIDVEIGVDVQAYDAGLQSFSALPTLANRIPYSTATNVWAETELSSFVRGILDDPDAATLRSSLGLGSLAVLNDLSSFDSDDIAEGSTNQFFTNERVDDRVAALCVAGSNMTITYNDGAGTLTFDSSGGGGGAGLVDADYGDITVSSSGTVMTIDNDVVTYAKMQNVSATSRFLGRKTAGAGDVEELSATDAKTILAIANTDVSGLGTLSTQNGTFSGTHSGTSSGTNTGDQTSIVGITGTKAEFNTACTDGNFLYVGDVTSGIANVVEDTTPQLGGDLDLNGFQITSPDGTDQINIPNGTIDLITNSTSRVDITDSGVRLGGANARVTTILDEDTMSSNSATALCTQQSIKAYVDANAGGGGLTIGKAYALSIGSFSN